MKKLIVILAALCWATTSVLAGPPIVTDPSSPCWPGEPCPSKPAAVSAYIP